MEHEDTQERTDDMSENMVAIRCKSELNPWMDCVMVVPQEQADDIEQSIKERMRGFERNGSCYGDVMREIAQAAGIESLALCDYDEDTDEPTDAWCEYCAGLSQKMPVIEIDIGELGDEVNIDDLLDKAEELGWCVRESDTEWEFIQSSPAGEDFFFDISASDVRNADDMVREIRSYANSFDAEEHAKMWIEAQGRVSGVPDLKTLVKDADAIKEMLDELAAAVANDEDNAEGDDDEEEGVNSLEDAYEWILNNFNIDGAAACIIQNVLYYADRMEGDEQYDFLTEMLDGTIGLSDREIRNLCWN